MPPSLELKWGWGSYHHNVSPHNGFFHHVADAPSLPGKVYSVFKDTDGDLEDGDPENIDPHFYLHLQDKEDGTVTDG